MATQISKKRKFCADGVFKAELNEMLMRELAEDGCVLPLAQKPPRTPPKIALSILPLPMRYPGMPGRGILLRLGATIPC